MIAVLTELADHPLGVTLDELAGKLHSSKPTVHRALATLRRAGLADMTGRGVYILGDEYLRLAFRNLDGRPETARIQPLLEELAAQFGETAHYAVLSGKDIVYRAKMDPPQGAVRLTSVIGGRNPAYRTAVGKALLSSRLLDLDAGDGLVRRVPARAEDTAHPHHAGGAPRRIRGHPRPRLRDRRSGERGRRQLRRRSRSTSTVPPTPSGAISVSAVRFRTPLESLVDAVPAIRETIGQRLGENALR